MKKIFLSLLAVAALASCTKSEVLYEAPQEIGFAPSSKNITKAAMSAGAGLQDTCKLGIWAFWNGVNGTDESPVEDYTKYNDVYLQNAQFINRKDNNNNSTVNWGGEGVAYPWPTNGALVFAGYNKPNIGLNLNCVVSYSFLDNVTTTDINESDQMTFENYVQSLDPAKTFDLAWFGRTAASYNHRANGDAVSVVLSHALSWITIKVYGEGTTTTAGSEWKIKKITLNDIANIGTGVCSGSGAGAATWTCTTYNSDMVIYNCTNATSTDEQANGKKLTTTATNIENTINGTVVIPQTINPNNQTGESRLNHTLTIEYTYPVAGNLKDGVAIVPLDLTKEGIANKWLSGTHYTYTLLFKANEILVAPSYGEWASENQTVTVE